MVGLSRQPRLWSHFVKPDNDHPLPARRFCRIRTKQATPRLLLAHRRDHCFDLASHLAHVEAPLYHLITSCRLLPPRTCRTPCSAVRIVSSRPSRCRTATEQAHPTHERAQRNQATRLYRRASCHVAINTDAVHPWAIHRGRTEEAKALALLHHKVEPGDRHLLLLAPAARGEHLWHRDMGTHEWGVQHRWGASKSGVACFRALRGYL